MLYVNMVYLYEIYNAIYLNFIFVYFDYLYIIYSKKWPKSCPNIFTPDYHYNPLILTLGSDTILVNVS